MSEAAGESPREDERLLKALAAPRRGAVYDLASGWWPGMPGAIAHPPFSVLTYRSPRGEHLQRDLPFLKQEENSIRFSFVSEMIMGSSHTGTHVDALCHITCGAEDTWYGGESANDNLGDFGALSKDAAELPPLIGRGVMLDVPGLHGGDRLPPGHGVDGEQLQGACERQGVEVRPGDVVLVRTGQMRDWPDAAAMAASEGVGVSMDGARWLLDREAGAVGADTASFEMQPSRLQGDPQPVHVLLVREHGKLIMEWVNCEELARDGVSSFLFVALPLTIAGATGSMIRPVAIA